MRHGAADRRDPRAGRRGLSFRVGGRITERLVNVGDHVTADQVLARLDPQQQQATVTAAEAAVQAAEAVLRRGDLHLRAPEGAARPGLHDQAGARSGSGSLPYGPGRARHRKGPARHRPRPSFRHGAAGRRSRRHHGPQCRDGQVVQVAQTVFSIAQDGPRDAVFNVYESIFTREPRQSHHRADAGVRSGRDGQGHRA